MKNMILLFCISALRTFLTAVSSVKYCRFLLLFSMNVICIIFSTLWNLSPNKDDDYDTKMIVPFWD